MSVLIGQVDASGQYISRLTATYPDQLCSQFAEIVHPLLSHGNQNLTLQEWETRVPQKGLHDLPHARNVEGDSHPMQIGVIQIAPKTFLVVCAKTG